MKLQQSNRSMALAVVFSASLLAPSALHARDADFGEQWVRNHPFTISALAQTPGVVDGAEYTAAGFNTFLAWKRPAELLPIAVGQGLPWHFHVSETTLTSDVMNEITTSYNNNPGNTGWLIHDEPRRLEMNDVAGISDWVKQQYPSSLVYTNLLPFGADAVEYYGDNSNPGYSYTDYLNDAMNIIQPDVLMYDLYTLGYGDMGHSDFWYTNMMVARSVAQSKGVPYWAFIQAFEQVNPPSNRRLPSESDLRFQMNSLLAAGFTGFHYFAYDGVGDRAVVDLNGDPTPLHAIAGPVNADVMTLGNVTKHLTSTGVRFIPGVGHSAPGFVPDWSENAGGDTIINHLALDTNAAFGDSTGDFKDGLVGFFTDDDGERYFMIVNAYHGDALTSAATTLHYEVRLDAGNELLWLNPDTGQGQLIQPDAFGVYRLTIGGGDAMLFKYNTGVDFIPEPASAGVILLAGLLTIARRSRRRR